MKAAAIQHGVEVGYPRRDALLKNLVVETERGDGQHAKAVLVNEERIFIRSMGRAAIFHDAKSTRRNLVLDAMIEQEDAIGNVFLKAMPCEGAVAALRGDHSSEFPLLQPVEQTTNFGAQDRNVRERGEQTLDRV